MRVSCAFPTTMSSPEDIRIAEDLGYERAWLYDTPQQSPDVWMSLALAAERTSRIGLGPGVLIPSLRHPMTNAAATATLAGLAPGRVAVSFGTGFTGRRAMGYRAIPWSYMTAYIDAYCGLLRGEVVEWRAPGAMLHPDGSGPFDQSRCRSDGASGRRAGRGCAPDGCRYPPSRPRTLRLRWVPTLWGTVQELARRLLGARLAARRPGPAPSPITPLTSFRPDAVPTSPGQGVARGITRAGGRTPPRVHVGHAPPTRPTGRRGRRQAERCCRRDGHRHRERSEPASTPRREGVTGSSSSRATRHPRELEAMCGRPGG